MSHRRIGSVGASSDPSRIVKGKSMPGHMGYDHVTTQNLKVIKVDLANNLLVIKGAVPGPKNGILEIRKSIKKKPKVK
jgi:large subunit ribosomal protein L3